MASVPIPVVAPSHIGPHAMAQSPDLIIDGTCIEYDHPDRLQMVEKGINHDLDDS
jgi:hypothetical protein